MTSSARSYVESAKAAGASTQAIATGLGKLQAAQKGATLGYKALSLAGNIALNIGVMAAISGIMWLLQSAERHTQELADAAKQASQKVKDIQSEIDSLNSAIKKYDELNLSGEWNNTPLEEKRKLQEEINKLLGDEAEKVNLITGSYEDNKKVLVQEWLDKKRESKDAHEKAARAAQDQLDNDIYWDWKNEKYRGLIVSKPNEKILAFAKKYNEIFDVFKDLGIGEQKIRTKLPMERGTFGTEQIKQAKEEIEATYTPEEIKSDETLSRIYEKLTSGYDAFYGTYKRKNDELKGAGNDGSVIEFFEKVINSTVFGGELKSVEEYKSAVDALNEYAKNNNWSDEQKDYALQGLEQTFSDLANKAAQADRKVKGAIEGIKASLGDLKSASENFSDLGTAFKELSEDGYVSIKTIDKIKDGVGNYVDNWDEYEKKLLTAKKGSAEFNKILTELTYAQLETTFGTTNLTDEAFL